ncbi:hypothetical protein IKG73_02475 [Candidatus Saccharibacteria bacterium]|nr:hypothetical protein [Candidatus Saccharibacteria bacterium]
MLRKNYHAKRELTVLERQASSCYNKNMKKHDTISGDDRINRALKKVKKMGLSFDYVPCDKIDIEKVRASAKKIRNDVVEYHEEIVAV